MTIVGQKTTYDDDLQARIGDAPQRLVDDHAATGPVLAADRRTNGARIYVHDDVLANPDAYRALALRQRFRSVTDGPVTFHGMAPCADPAIPMWIAKVYPTLTPTLSFFRQSPQDQVEPHFIHDDRSMGDWTAILYLQPAAPLLDGTSFWQRKATGATASTATDVDAHIQEGLAWHDPAQWTRWHTVTAKYNRLILFPANLFHSRAIRANYGSGDGARLIQIIFGTGELA